MTPNQIVKAREAVRELSKIVLPYKVARQVTALKRRIDEEFETITSMESALTEEFGGKPEHGRIQFPDNETAAAFEEKMRVYMEEDVQVQLPLVDLTKYADNIRISPASIEALDGLVRFEREEGSDG